MKSDFNKSHAQLIALALDSALPRLKFFHKISEEEEDYLFKLELSFLDSNGFSIHFDYEENNEENNG